MEIIGEPEGHISPLQVPEGRALPAPSPSIYISRNSIFRNFPSPYNCCILASIIANCLLHSKIYNNQQILEFKVSKLLA